MSSAWSNPRLIDQDVGLIAVWVVMLALRCVLLKGDSWFHELGLVRNDLLERIENENRERNGGVLTVLQFSRRTPGGHVWAS